MRLFAEDREIFAKPLPIHDGVSNLVHPIICSMGHRAPLYSQKIICTSAMSGFAADTAAFTVTLVPRSFLRRR